MHYIKQIFKGEVDEWAHQMFIKYGKGEYDGAACKVEVGKKIKYSSTVEYTNVLGHLTAKCGGEIDVDGAIYAKTDFRADLDETGVDYDDSSKPKKGYFVAKINGTYPGDVLEGIYENMPYATILLNLKGEVANLKCKKKPPKPGGKKDNKFTSGTLDLKVYEELKDEIFFGVDDFKKAEVENIYVIEGLIIPEGMGPAEARLHAKRTGTVKRTITADGNKIESECDLLI